VHAIGCENTAVPWPERKRITSSTEVNAAGLGDEDNFDQERCQGQPRSRNPETVESRGRKTIQGLTHPPVSSSDLKTPNH
jgi:hypothetical protein